MKRQIGIIMAVWFITSAFLRADTSYLLIQGPFGSGSSTLTYKFEVNYPTGYLMTSQDLLDVVLTGVPLTSPQPDGTLQGDDTFGPVPIYTNGNSQQGGEYVYYPPDPPTFPTASFITYAFTLGSTTVTTNDNVPVGDSTLGWNLYVEGGDASNNGIWNFSEEGQSDRAISNGSYDGWVFGDTGSDPDFSPAGTTTIVDDSSNSDSPSDFFNTGPDDVFMVVDVPEPATPVLLGIALGGLILWKKKARA